MLTEMRISAKMALVIFIIAVSGSAFAQPEILWSYHYDFGDNGCYSGAQSVKQTPDGGFITAGYQENGGVLLVKFDSEGSVVWKKNYWQYAIAFAEDIQPTNDGNNYIVCGYRQDGPDMTTMLLLKIDANGDSLWSRVFDAGWNPTMGRFVLPTSDDGYLVGGELLVDRTHYIYLVKTDANGDTLWTKQYEDDGIGARSGVLTADGQHAVFVGNAYDPNREESDILLTKIDMNGDTLWTRTWGEAGVTEIGYSVVESADDSGYVICGQANSNNYRIKLIKTDRDGNTIWQSAFGEEWDLTALQGYGTLVKAMGGGYVFGSLVSSNDTKYVWLVKTDPDGNMVWENLYDAHIDDRVRTMQLTTDGGIVLAGAGHMTSEDGNLYLYLARTEPVVGIEEEEPIPASFMLHSNYPNPFNASTRIQYDLPTASNVTIEVFDILGKKVESFSNGIQPAGRHTIIWNAEDFSTGMYFYKLTAGEYSESKKMLLIK